MQDLNPVPQKRMIKGRMVSRPSGCYRYTLKTLSEFAERIRIESIKNVEKMEKEMKEEMKKEKKMKEKMKKEKKEMNQ